MKQIQLLLVLTTVLVDVIRSSPLDDGKYRPKKYRNDGRYYRPPQEGKYVHTDDGKYFIIYQKGIYPIDDGDYRYIHMEGPRGPEGWNFGREGRAGFGGGEGSGGFDGSGDGSGFIGFDGFDGFGGADGPFGPKGPLGPNGPDGPNVMWSDGDEIYADKYPYIKKLVIELADRYASNNTINYGDKSEESINYYNELKEDNATAVKCHFLYSEKDDEIVLNESPEQQPLDNDNYVGTYYRFSGTKCVDTVSSLTRAKKKLKLHYEVFVKVIDEFTEPTIEPADD